jgi:DNA polymerase III delta prime subunit
MNSRLIVGATFQDRLKQINLLLTTYHLSLNKPHPDLLSIEPDPSVRIRHVREAQRFLSRKPYQAEIKAVVVGEAEKMTIPAQNAFLKTLEEPPADSLIFLCSPNEELLLPTIVSRCEVVRLNQSSQLINDQKLLTSHFSLLKTLVHAQAGERLKLIEPYEKTREEAIKFCEEMIRVLRSNLINKVQPILRLRSGQATYNLQLTTIIPSFQQAFNLLQANINVKLVMDNLIINLPK